MINELSLAPARVFGASGLFESLLGTRQGSESGTEKVDQREVLAVSPASDEAVRQTADQALVQRAQAGDNQAFRQLVEKYQARAHAVALGVLGNYQDAEDMVQEAFIKAYHHLSSFEGKSSFYTWFYRIIFNLSIDLSRKAYRRSEWHAEDAAALDSAARSAGKDSGEYISRVRCPDEHMRQVEIRRRFAIALGELSTEHRAVIILREIDGLSYAEISDVIGCSKGTIMSRLHHARRKLQKSLGDLMPGVDSDKTDLGLVEASEAEQLRS